MADKKKERGPQFIPSPLNNKMLNYQEYYMSPGEKILYTVILMAAGGLLGLLFYGGLFQKNGEATTATMISNIVVFIVMGVCTDRVFMKAVVAWLKEKRMKKLNLQFRDLLDTISASLSAGGTVNNAFMNAKSDMLSQYSEGDYIILELTEIENGLRNGQNLEDMLLSFGERSGIEDIMNFSNVIGSCYRMGGNFKDVVRKTKDIIGDKMTVAEEINTKLASNKLQLNAMCIMPVVLVAMLKSSSASFKENLASPMGVVVTTVALGIFVASYFWGSKIVDIK